MELDLDMVKYPRESVCLYYLRLAQHLISPFLWAMAIYFACSLPRISLVHKNLRIILVSFLSGVFKRLCEFSPVPRLQPSRARPPIWSLST